MKAEECVHELGVVQGSYVRAVQEYCCRKCGKKFFVPLGKRNQNRLVSEQDKYGCVKSIQLLPEEGVSPSKNAMDFLEDFLWFSKKTNIQFHEYIGGKSLEEKDVIMWKYKKMEYVYDDFMKMKVMKITEEYKIADSDTLINDFVDWTKIREED
jgi:hypothetical protein